MTFINGIELCRRFQHEIIDPVLKATFPNLPYSSALIGAGSEVLGYDTEMSTDHDWGPRVYLFLQEWNIEMTEVIHSSLQQQAPQRFNGYPVDMKMTMITTVQRFIESGLAINMNEPIEYIDWLTFPSQTLLEITKGEVYRDDKGQLSVMREMFNYYPHDIWLYLMASTWQRIGQEEHLMLRSGFVGDELGSSIIASRIVRDVIHLCFFMERQYAPYPKWFGTAFKSLSCFDLVMPHLWHVQTANTWQERQSGMNMVYKSIAGMHNALGITERIAEDASFFFNRPFKVMNGGAIGQFIANEIKNTELRHLSEKYLIGSIDQITDNVDIQGMNKWPEGKGKLARNALLQLYQSCYVN